MHTNDPQEPTDQTWPGRYSVRAEVTYRDRRGKRCVFQVIAFQPEMTAEECVNLLQAIGYSPADERYRNLTFQAMDTFSVDQADALVSYLNKRNGTLSYKKSANIPRASILGASAIPTLPSFKDGMIFRYYTDSGYDLPFKAASINTKTYIYMSRLYNELKQMVQD